MLVGLVRARIGLGLLKGGHMKQFGVVLLRADDLAFFLLLRCRRKCVHSGVEYLRLERF